MIFLWIEVILYKIKNRIITLHFELLVFKAFDRDNDGQVNMLEWVVGLNIYLRGTLDEKIACKFLS